MSNKFTIRQRVKALVLRVVARVKRVTKVVAFKTVIAARVTWAKVATAWRQSLRPMLKVVGAVAAATAWTSAILIVPIGTIGITTAAGLALIALSALLERLDRSTSKVAHAVIRVIEMFAQVLRASFYVFSAAFVIATLPAWAPVFAAYAAAAFLLRALPEPANAVPSPRIIDAEWEVPTATRRHPYGEPDTRPRSPDHAVELGLVAGPKHKAIRATGAEEMRDLPACSACGDIEAEARFRSHDVRYGERVDAMLCSECYDLEQEDNALKYTGVSLKKVSVDVRLNEAGLRATTECEASVKDLDHVFWSKEPTAWWRDRNGQLHARAWSCFNGGEVVATVSFDYRRGVYRAAALGKVVGGPQRTLQLAQKLANDALFDESNAVTRLMQDLDVPATYATGKAG